MNWISLAIGLLAIVCWMILWLSIKGIKEEIVQSINVARKEIDGITSILFREFHRNETRTHHLSKRVDEFFEKWEKENSRKEVAEEQKLSGIFLAGKDGMYRGPTPEIINLMASDDELMRKKMGVRPESPIISPCCENCFYMKNKGSEKHVCIYPKEAGFGESFDVRPEEHCKHWLRNPENCKDQ